MSFIFVVIIACIYWVVGSVATHETAEVIDAKAKEKARTEMDGIRAKWDAYHRAAKIAEEIRKRGKS
jgi:hypothetical protein